MRYARLFILAMVPLLLAGCFQVETVVRVNPDGSGTVVERMLLSKKMLAQVEAMMQGFAGESGGKPAALDIFDPAKLKVQAGSMGEGVSYLSGKRVTTPDYSGYEAIYAFSDINKLRFGNQGEGAGATAGGKAPSLPALFRFTKGSPATLIIEQPEENKSAPEAAPTDAGAPPAPAAPEGELAGEEAKKLAGMFMGMKFLFAVEVNGTIIETNATHRTGNRLTLVDFDLGKFGSAIPQLEKLNRLRGGSAEDAMLLLRDFPGVKVELNRKLKVVFGK